MAAPAAKAGRPEARGGARNMNIQPPANSKLYVVQSHDTLAGIAVKFNMPMGILMSTNRLFSPSVFAGQQLWVRDPDAPALANATAILPAAVPPPVKPNLDAVAAAAAAVAASKVMVAHSPAADKRALTDTTTPTEERADAAPTTSRTPLTEGSSDAGPLEEHIWWRIMPNKAPVVMEGMLAVTDDAMTLSRLSATEGSPALSGPITFPLSSVKECLLLPHLRDTFADIIKAHFIASPSPEAKNYVYFRLRVRDPKAHAASVQAGPAAAEVYHYYDCAMQSTHYGQFYTRLMLHGGFDMAVSEIFMEADDIGDEPAAADAVSGGGLGGFMQAIWGRSKGESTSSAKLDVAAVPVSTAETAASPDTADVDAILDSGGRPKSKSFNGGSAPSTMASLATAAASTATGSFLSKLTPLIPSQLMRATPKPSSGTAAAGDGATSVPASAAAPSDTADAEAARPPRASRRRKSRRPDPNAGPALKPAQTTLHMADDDVDMPLGKIPTSQRQDTHASHEHGHGDAAELSGHHGGEDAKDAHHHGAHGDGDDDESGDDADTDGAGDDDDVIDDGSDASWDGLDDIYAGSANAPSAVVPPRRRSNSDAGSVHSALSVTNLVGKYKLERRARGVVSAGTMAQGSVRVAGGAADRRTAGGRLCSAHRSRFRPRLSRTSEIMKQSHVDRHRARSSNRVPQIVRTLPKRLQLSDWHLIYSTYSHGITLSTLYSKVQQLDDPGESILVIRDNKGDIFGCFATHPWRQEPFYYGGGEMFLFRLHPIWKVYHWTGKNDYFQLGHHNCLAVGGSGTFALWMDQQLYHGSSARCETFDNDVLAHSEDFLVMGLELWGFLPSL